MQFLSQSTLFLIPALASVHGGPCHSSLIRETSARTSRPVPHFAEHPERPCYGSCSMVNSGRVAERCASTCIVFFMRQLSYRLDRLSKQGLSLRRTHVAPMCNVVLA